MHPKVAVAGNHLFTACRTAATALLFGTALAAAGADLHLASPRDASQPSTPEGGGDSFLPIISPDGRYVLFGSTAGNLAVNGSGLPYNASNPAKINVYRRDRATGTSTLVSVNLDGTGGASDDCIPLGISTNGQFALFESGATNLIPGYSNRLSAVFVRDLFNNLTILVSASTNNTAANGKSFWDSSMTPDGRYVAFTSAATNLVPAYTNGITGVFVRDLPTGQTTLVSVGAKNAGGFFNPPSSSDAPCLSPDGRYVVFLSTATNLVPGVISSGEIYLRDLLVGTTSILSSNAHAYISGSLRAYSPRLSDDGQWLAFQASAASSPTTAYVFRHDIPAGTDDLVTSNAVPPDEDYRYVQTLDMTPDGRFITFIANTNSVSGATPCIFRWDGQTATTTLVDVDVNGVVPAGSAAEMPLIDDSGRYILFKCTGANLTTNLVDNGPHLYLRDVQAGTTLIDAATNGVGSARNFQGLHCMSSDGRFVAFDCTDADLVPQDDNQACDVFARDLTSNICELVSSHAAGLESQSCFSANSTAKLSLSADGRYLAFVATTRAMLANCTNGFRGIFVRDLVYGTNLLVSVDTNGLPNANGAATDPAISADGRYVVFSSAANNLVPGDTNNSSDVFRRDLQSGITILISLNVSGTGPGNGSSRKPSISRDGKYVLFYSTAANLSADSVNAGAENLVFRDCARGTNRALTVSSAYSACMTPDGRFIAFDGSLGGYFGNDLLYVWDSEAARRVCTNAALGRSVIPFSFGGSGQWLAVRAPTLYGGETVLVDILANTNLIVSVNRYGAGSTFRAGAHFSGEGRFLVYTSTGADVPADTNNWSDVYLYDSWNGTRQLVSQNPVTGQAANSLADGADLSADGRYVVFESLATDIVSPANGSKNVFLRDMQTGESVLLSTSALGGGAANGDSFGPAFSADGQTLVFRSAASDLVTNDFNQGPDIFVLKIASTNPIASYAGQLVYAPDRTIPPTLTWPATAGCSYQVQFKDNLTDPIWRALNAPVTIGNNQASATDTNSGSGHRFYRIVAARP